MKFPQKPKSPKRIGFRLFKKKGFYVFTTNLPNVWVWTSKHKGRFFFEAFQPAFIFKPPLRRIT